MTHAVADDWPRRVAILGVGLLGGSVALAMRRVRPQTTFVGYARERSETPTADSKDGIVDIAVDSIEAGQSRLRRDRGGDAGRSYCRDGDRGGQGLARTTA